MYRRARRCEVSRSLCRLTRSSSPPLDTVASPSTPSVARPSLKSVGRHVCVHLPVFQCVCKWSHTGLRFKLCVGVCVVVVVSLSVCGRLLMFVWWDSGHLCCRNVAFALTSQAGPMFFWCMFLRPEPPRHRWIPVECCRGQSKRKSARQGTDTRELLRRAKPAPNPCVGCCPCLAAPMLFALCGGAAPQSDCAFA